MKKKITNNTTQSKNKPTDEIEQRITLLESYGMPIPDSFIEELRIIMREWSDKPTSLRIKDFLTENRIGHRTFYSFVERNDKFKQEYEWALDKIASRRELGVGKYKLHPVLLRMMPRYDPEWVENEEKLAKIKRLSQAEVAQGQTIIAVIPEVPHSNLVPTREDKDNE
jgi:hypothetical protein